MHSSKLSLSMFTFYITDMPRPTKPLKWVCYADADVWATGVKVPELEDSINSYLDEITTYPEDNSLLIFTPKSSVTLFPQDTHQANTHPQILIEDSQLTMVQSPKIVGIHLDTSLSFDQHSNHVAENIHQKQYHQGLLLSTHSYAPC